MPKTSLAYRVAEDHVHRFGDAELWLKQQHEALDCVNCEAFLQLGIDAFRWILRADEAYRKAVYAGAIQDDPEVDQAIVTLLKSWLAPCGYAQQWIAKQQQRGYDVDNLEEFRQAEQEVRAIVNSLDNRELPDAMRKLRDQAVTDYHDGKTAEFV